jgi:hypothetical protein
MILRKRFVDAMIDGKIGNGLVVTRTELMQFFKDDNPDTVGCLLSNSEMTTGTHSPTYTNFTLRAARGTYRIHPAILMERMKERALLPTAT